MTDSTLLLGLVSFAGRRRCFFISPFAGVTADRVNRRRILFVTQTLMMSFAFILATLTLTGVIQVWEIIILASSFGMANAFRYSHTPIVHGPKWWAALICRVPSRSTPSCSIRRAWRDRPRRHCGGVGRRRLVFRVERCVVFGGADEPEC